MFVQNADEKFLRLLSLFRELAPKYQQVVLQMIEILRNLD
jgi:hypothetical protein